MTKAIINGSMADMAKREGKPLATTWLNVACVVYCDTSGSMHSRDSRNGQSRYDVMISELEILQGKYQGKIAVIGFSNAAEWYPDGIPYFVAGGTNMVDPLEFGKMADNGKVKFVMISDGVPDDETGTLRVARTYSVPIDTIYVGPEDDREDGRKFLKKLASATGGRHQDDFNVDKLESKIAGLLNG